MPPTPITFTPEAVAKIQQVIRQVLGEPRDPRTDPAGESPPTRDHLWALTPSGGIPARDVLELGHATCELYSETVDAFGSDTRSLTEIVIPGGGTATAIVHNCGTSKIDGDRYVPIERSNGGAWRVAPPPKRKRHGFTPAGGIAKATKSGATITPGSATIEEWEYDWDVAKYVPLLEGSAQVTVTVYNEWPAAIGGGKWISFSHDDDGLLTIENEACESF